METNYAFDFVKLIVVTRACVQQWQEPASNQSFESPNINYYDNSRHFYSIDKKKQKNQISSSYFPPVLEKNKTGLLGVVILVGAIEKSNEKRNFCFLDFTRNSRSLTYVLSVKKDLKF